MSDDRLRRIAAALDRIPEDERAGVLAHLEGLAAMSAGRRAALLTLTREGDR